jgi:hypothetical protein
VLAYLALLLTFSLNLAGCAWFREHVQTELPLDERPRLAFLPFGVEAPIKTLASVKSMEKELQPDEEARVLAATLQEIRNEARWLLQSGLAAGQQFKMVSLEETDAAVADLGIKAGEIPTPAQLCALKARLKADLVLEGNILDYGKVRWQWLLGGMLTDISAETLVLGLATGGNVPIMLGNAGFELLTSTPIWFGGGYLFGIAVRPVGVEARALETVHGEPVWQDEEATIWGRGRLKQVSETERAKKEIQLYVNLSKAMEEIADSLNEQNFRVSGLRERQSSTKETGCQ